MKKIFALLSTLVSLSASANCSKIPVKEWCEVNGVYTEYHDETNTAIHVCSFTSQTKICYYIPCDEANKLKKGATTRSTIINNLEPGILIPSSNGLTYCNGNITVIQETENQVIITIN
ncbi:MAG: hypothetical protein LCH37_03965 [Bacteroidetes bacterium]|nr:hypothetical protein [Bacteroidota bacterium]